MLETVIWEKCMKNNYKIENVIFFGCGKLGKEMLDFWNLHGRQPRFFCDNNSDLWGKKICNIIVINPKELMDVNYEKIILSLSHWEEVRKQLCEMGINREKIVSPNFILDAPTLKAQAKYLYSSEIQIFNTSKGRKIFIDLSCGMVLGGVERWSYSLANILKQLGYEGEYILPINANKQILDESFPNIEVGENEKDKIDIFEAALSIFNKEKNAMVICNFPFEIFQAACVAKNCSNNNLKIISIIHNDEDIYFDVYGVWKKEIDYCLVISKKIYKRLFHIGFPKEKILIMNWNMEFPKIKKKYSLSNQPLHIGYAGRISITQKRVDMLIEIAKKLKQRKLNFVITIAGSGDYENELKKEILNNNIDKNIAYIGLLPHEKIFDFWSKQDIFISCSEFEGHSISQVEAMAMGVVPVVTNTSGVEDDITNGLNGYIVDIGDIETMVEHLQLLCNDRERLQRMGNRAYEDIRKRCNIYNERDFWAKLFERISF